MSEKTKEKGKPQVKPEVINILPRKVIRKVVPELEREGKNGREPRKTRPRIGPRR